MSHRGDDDCGPAGVAAFLALTPVLSQPVLWAAAWADLNGHVLTVVDPYASHRDAAEATKNVVRLVRRHHQGLTVRLETWPHDIDNAWQDLGRRCACVVLGSSADEPVSPNPPKNPLACPVVLVPSHPELPRAGAPVTLILRSGADEWGPAAFAFAFASRTGRSLRALICGEDPDSASTIRVMVGLAQCYPSLTFDCHSIGIGADEVRRGSLDSTLVVTGAAQVGERIVNDCAFDPRGLAADVGCPVAIVVSDARPARLAASGRPMVAGEGAPGDAGMPSHARPTSG